MTNTDDMMRRAGPGQGRFGGLSFQSLRRGGKILLMRALKSGGAFQLSSQSTRQSIPILCYHGVWPVSDGFPGDAMFIRPETFQERMQLIERLGLHVVSLDNAVDALNGGARVPENSVVITIDDGWYGTFRYMMPALLEHGFPATLYCDTAQLQRGGVVPHVMARYVRMVAGAYDLSPDAVAAYEIATDVSRDYNVRKAALDDFVGQIGFDVAPYLEERVFEYMTASEFRQFADAGFDVQLHTHNHTMWDLSAQAVGAELQANVAALSELTGRSRSSFQHFCYPSGVTSAAVADRLRHDGIKSATTTVADLAQPETHICLLPRIIDGDNMSEIEFEAELTGVAAKLRQVTA